MKPQTQILDLIYKAIVHVKKEEKEAACHHLNTVTKLVERWRDNNEELRRDNRNVSTGN